MKESDIEKLCRLAAAQNDMVIWRNHRGAAKTDRGGFITFGLGPDGASDEIGFTKVKITPDMVGDTVAVFTAIEIKKPGSSTAKKRLKSQKRFVSNIKEAGGIAGFARSPEDIKKILEKYLTK